MKLTITGDKELNQVLGNIPVKAKKAASNELEIILLDLKGKSQRIAPVETGDLVGSAYKVHDNLYGEVGYEQEYATIQHENLEYKHSEGKQAKYLETPFKENSKQYIKGIGDAIKKAVD